MIGQAIQRYRKLNRYTQKQLGAQFGMSQVIISNIEKGARKVSSDELVEFAKFFNVKVTDLLMSSQIHATHKKEEKKC